MAQIKEEQIEIPELNPFANCKLGREEYADNLTEIINTYSNGFVLAIDNKWGAGKTTFIKMWETKLRMNGYNAVYFNSWENDLEVDPFVGIMAELKKLGVGKPLYEELVLKAGKISTKALPVLLKGVISKFIGDGSVKELMEIISAQSSDFLRDQIDSYSERKETISEFKNQLEVFVKENTDVKPLVYFVDELDRCRPDYAVLVLEKIKHLFSVPGIVFVLSIDKEQLCNSIKGFYGSDKIDSVEYLKRFIDIEYILPQPEVKKYCEYLNQRYGFDDFFKSEQRLQINQFKDDGKDFIEFAISLSIKENLTLRSIDKLFSHSNLVVKQFSFNNVFYSLVVFWLIFIRMKNIKLFEKIVHQEFTPQELVDECESQFYSYTNENNINAHLRSFARLIKLYSNEYKINHHNFLLITRDGEILNISLKQFDSNLMKDYLKHLDRDDQYNLKISFILNKINLFDNVKN